MKRLFTSILFFSFLSLNPLFAETITVSGDVSGTWSADTVLVTGEIRVPPGETLVIEPGVKVLFQIYCKFIIDSTATLLAVGTETDSILFDEFYPDTSWHGIRFLNASDSCRLEYCYITHGDALGSGEDRYGGGIYLNNTNLSISSCLIENCTAAVSGGGVYCSDSSDGFIANNIISGNYAVCGGGLCVIEANPTLTSNIITENSAEEGGGMYLDYCNFTMNNNFIIFNVVSSSWSLGGGICCKSNASPTIINSIICDNSANGLIAEGGGICCWTNSNPTIINSIICNNTGWELSGGGIYSSNCNPTLINCILWGNYYGQIYEWQPQEVAITFSNIQGSWPGEGNIDEDPLFVIGSLSDYHLSPDSPCIDAGNPDPQYNDPEDPMNPGLALWPALGTVRNDMGAYGGGGTSGWLGLIGEEITSLPSDFSLAQNYPNPFNALTTISYSLPTASNISLMVYNVQGCVVTQLIDGWRPAGTHEITFDASDLASGIYIYRLDAGQFTASGKMVLMK